MSGTNLQSKSANWQATVTIAEIDRECEYEHIIGNIQVRGAFSNVLKYALTKHSITDYAGLYLLLGNPSLEWLKKYMPSSAYVDLATRGGSANIKSFFEESIEARRQKDRIELDEDGYEVDGLSFAILIPSFRR
jgi:hypothetical protein